MGGDSEGVGLGWASLWHFSSRLVLGQLLIHSSFSTTITNRGHTRADWQCTARQCGTTLPPPPPHPRKKKKIPGDQFLGCRYGNRAVCIGRERFDYVNLSPSPRSTSCSVFLRLAPVHRPFLLTCWWITNQHLSPCECSCCRASPFWLQSFVWLLIQKVDRNFLRCLSVAVSEPLSSKGTVRTQAFIKESK